MSVRTHSVAEAASRGQIPGRPARRRRAGFTLVELIVVMGIVALMIAILVPSLQRAHEQAKAVMCATNMRQVAQLVSTFAAANDGRSPGGGARGYPDNDGSSIAWCDILDMVMLQNTNSNNEYGVGARYVTSSAKTLSCPDFIVQGYDCAYAYNTWASGGSESEPKVDPVRGNPYYTISRGKPIYPPERVNKYFDTKAMTKGAMGKYWLGAKLERFRSGDFLMIEWEHANPTTDGSGGNGKGQVVLNVLGNSYPPYSSNGGSFSFRHPYFKLANFLCFDGHVEMHSPKDNISVEGGQHFIAP